MVDLPPPNRIESLLRRLLAALDKARIRPCLDLGHVELMQAAGMFEGRLTREQFVELAGQWWDLVISVEGPVPEAEREPLPDSSELESQHDVEFGVFEDDGKFIAFCDIRGEDRRISPPYDTRKEATAHNEEAAKKLQAEMARRGMRSTRRDVQ